MTSGSPGGCPATCTGHRRHQLREAVEEVPGAEVDGRQRRQVLVRRLERARLVEHPVPGARCRRVPRPARAAAAACRRTGSARPRPGARRSSSSRGASTTAAANSASETASSGSHAEVRVAERRRPRHADRRVGEAAHDQPDGDRRPRRARTPRGGATAARGAASRVAQPSLGPGPAMLAASCRRRLCLLLCALRARGLRLRGPPTSCRRPRRSLPAPPDALHGDRRRAHLHRRPGGGRRAGQRRRRAAHRARARVRRRRPAAAARSRCCPCASACSSSSTPARCAESAAPTPAAARCRSPPTASNYLYVTDAIGGSVLVFNTTPELHLVRRYGLERRTRGRSSTTRERRRLWVTLAGADRLAEMTTGRRIRRLRDHPTVDAAVRRGRRAGRRRRHGAAAELSTSCARAAGRPRPRAANSAAVISSQRAR